MALDILALLGSAAAWSLAKPILEDLAKDIAKDGSKSLLAKIFKKSLSKFSREPLSKATLLALKDFIELFEEELLNTDVSEELLKVRYQPFLEAFLKQEAFLGLLEPLFTEPQFPLDTAVLVRTWNEMPNAPTFPEEFSWERIAKAFKRKVGKIRDNNPDIKQAFERTLTEQSSAALLELQGLPAEFDQEAYREALLEKFQTVGSDCLDSTGVYYNEVRLWNVFVPQSSRECHDFKPQLLEIPKEHQKRLLESGEANSAQLGELEHLKEDQRRRYFEQPLRPVLEVCADKDLAHLVILGDPGSGKSSLLRYLALQWANLPTLNERLQQPLPLLIELRAYNLWACASGKSFLRYLHEASNWHRLNQQTLNYLMQQPDRIMLLLDGLDEVFDPVQREQVINDIHRFSNDYKQVRIIVTSRVVGYQPKALRDAEFRDFMLQDLDADQIQTFLKQWHAHTFEASKIEESELKRERLAKAINSSKSIALLAGNPLLLTMMAILNRHQELPRHRATLYQKASEVLLHQWDTERALEAYPELRNEFDLAAKVALLRRIAAYMQAAPQGLAGNIIHGAALTEIIESYLREELHFEQARGAANAMVKQLRERNFILCFIGADSYAFVHRTFLEYFCAADIVYKFNHQRALEIEDLIEIFDEHYADDAWREVLGLICGQVDEHFVGQIIENLTNKADSEIESDYPEIQLAILCVGETNKSERVSYSASYLLREIENIFFTNGSYNPVGILRAVSDVEKNWPISSLPLNLPNFTKNHTICLLWIVILGSLGISKENLISYLQSNLHFIRTGCLLALTRFVEPNCIDNLYNIFLYHASNDPDEFVRLTALEQISKKYQNQEIRDLLQHALTDLNTPTRQMALKQLAEYWPDQETYDNLVQALKDDNQAIRHTALDILYKYWPKSITQKLINLESYHNTFAAFIKANEHSKFGALIFQNDMEYKSTYHNPKLAINKKNISVAAAKANIPEADIPAMVKSLSQHIGWDITKGSAHRL